MMRDKRGGAIAACAAVLLALLGQAHGATPASDELQFRDHAMAAKVLPLRNPDFSAPADAIEARAVAGWTVSAGGTVSFREGRDGGDAVVLAQGAELEQDIATQSLPAKDGAIYLSAWVWSEEPATAHLRLSDGKTKTTVSAFHSGGARWEHLTVVHPYTTPPASVRASLSALNGRARFSQVRALTLEDDRFTGVTDSCNPLRERATYRKSTRVRIVVVGNSTVNGAVVADKRATFPYLLQAKLESTFPGRFEVLNFGICGWHLPPQIVTLDTVFNMHQWCNGAPWCGKETAFSHRTVLAGSPNADRNTPTVAQLRPDVIVFAGMWNDVWRVLRYAESGFAPHPDEVNRVGDVPASVEYLKAALAYADRPTPANFDAAEQAWQRASQPLDPALAASLDVRDVASLRASPAFARLVENARMKFAFLAAEFVRRGQRNAKVWTLALPGKLRDRYEEGARRLLAAGLLSEGEAGRFLLNGYIDAITDEVQATELGRVSRAMSVPFVDLSAQFHANHAAMSTGEQFALGYFLDNVEDNAHFSYRGNEWIADRVFLGFIEELSRLAGSPPK